MKELDFLVIWNDPSNLTWQQGNCPCVFKLAYSKTSGFWSGLSPLRWGSQFFWTLSTERTYFFSLLERNTYPVITLGSALWFHTNYTSTSSGKKRGFLRRKYSMHFYSGHKMKLQCFFLFSLYYCFSSFSCQKKHHMQWTNLLVKTCILIIEAIWTLKPLLFLLAETQLMHFRRTISFQVWLTLYRWL